MSDDDPELAKAAGAIASGAAADWRALESSVGDDSRPVLDELKVIGAITDFHQHLLEPSDPAMTPPPARAATGAPQPAGQWGALTLIEEIGRGAFSHVYRARDPKIDREVALKLLDKRAASETQAGIAIVEEGRLLARVRHPNIVTIHGADAIDGSVGIEMELIDGQTLEAVVRDQGPLGPDEAKLVARAVCRALAAIHRAGLVHRDVKAANVMREHGGRIVLMDLGSGSDVTETRDGALVGTPLYLAPEVLAGSAATPLSDFYSLGVLLFYLTTGTYPWVARSLQELRSAHATGQRARLRDHRPDLPERFIQVVERAMATSPGDRFHSAGDFEAALSETLERPTTDEARPRQISWKTVVVGAIGAATLASAIVWAIWPRAEAPAAAQRFVLALGDRLTMPSAPGAAEFALSPDGSLIVYSTSGSGRSGQLQVRAIDQFDARLLESTGDAGQPFFSPDGRSIGYSQTFPPSGRLVVQSLDGGPTTSLTEWRRPAGASWDRNGTIVYSALDDLWRIPERGGAPVQLTHTSREKDESAIRPQVLDDGAVIFTLRSNREQRSQLVALTPEDTIAAILDDAANGKFLPPGYLVFARGRSIMVAPFNARRLVLTGSPVELVTGQSDWFDVSRSGSLIYSAPETPATPDVAQFVWVDRGTGHESPIGLPRDRAYLPGTVRLSPDGLRIAVAIMTTAAEGVDEETRGRVWIGELSSGTLTPFTEQVAQPLAWTPDGLFLAYVNAVGAIAWKRADGARSEEVLVPATAGPFDRCTRGSWAPPAGQTLVVECAGNLIGFSLPPVGSPRVAPTVTPIVNSQWAEGAPTFSPDGRWLAYQSNQSGHNQVYVRAFPGRASEPASVVPGRVAHDPIWRGDELLYVSQDLPFAARVATEPTFRVLGDPRATLDRFPYETGSGGVGRFEVSPDGRRFLAMKGAGARAPQALTRLHLVLHWVEEVKKTIAPAR